MKNKVLLGLAGALFTLTFQSSYGMTVKDKTSEGKIHLGAILSAMMDGKNCALPEEDNPHDFVAPLFGMVTHMTGQGRFFGMLGVALPMCKKYFCKEYLGLDGFVEKEYVSIQSVLENMEEEKVAVPDALWCKILIKQTGEKFFRVPKKTKLSDDAYYLKIKKDCLKEVWEKEALYKDAVSFFKSLSEN